MLEVLWKQGELYTYKFETKTTWDVWMNDVRNTFGRHFSQLES